MGLFGVTANTWTAWGTCVLAGVTAALAVGAFWAAIYTKRAAKATQDAARWAKQAAEDAKGMLSVENDRDAEAAKERDARALLAEAEQARRVVVWYDAEKGAGFGDPLKHGAWLVNGSDLPIYDVNVSAYWASGLMQAAAADPIRVLPPKGAFNRWVEFASTLPDRQDWLAGVRFRDAFNVTWERRPDGTLTRT